MYWIFKLALNISNLMLASFRLIFFEGNELLQKPFKEAFESVSVNVA